jgi:hypothetical protein
MHLGPQSMQKSKPHIHIWMLYHITMQHVSILCCPPYHIGPKSSVTHKVSIPKLTHTTPHHTTFWNNLHNSKQEQYALHPPQPNIILPRDYNMTAALQHTWPGHYPGSHPIQENLQLPLFQQRWPGPNIAWNTYAYAAQCKIPKWFLHYDRLMEHAVSDRTNQTNWL